MSDPVLVSTENEIATITLNRPDAYNAFDATLMEPFARIVTELATDDAVRAVVVTGAGKAFCAGGDLKTISSHPSGPPSALHRLAGLFHVTITEVRRMAKPVIAAVNGVAAGGGFSLALAADFRVMARSAVLRCAYPSVGLCVDGGGTWTLPRLVGLHRALEIAALDAPIPAEKALAWGLATSVVDDGVALENALEMALGLLRRSGHSFACTKRLLLHSFETPLEVQLEHERHAIQACGAHPDGVEGMQAFVEKREPVFGRARPG